MTLPPPWIVIGAFSCLGSLVGAKPPSAVRIRSPTRITLRFGGAGREQRRQYERPRPASSLCRLNLLTNSSISARLISPVELAVNKNYGGPMETARRARMSTDERREQLLSAGVELLGRRGHDEVSIEEIAEAAGVSKGLLYHYFPTKKDFVLAALERGQEELAERLRPDPASTRRRSSTSASTPSSTTSRSTRPPTPSIFSRGGGGDPEIAAALDAAGPSRWRRCWPPRRLGRLAGQHRARRRPWRRRCRAGPSSSREPSCASSSTAASSAPSCAPCCARRWSAAVTRPAPRRGSRRR